MKVLHVLETSLPDPGGYTIRARAILEFQRRIGLEPVVVTSPLFPTRDRSICVEQVDGITYYRTNYIPTPSSATSRVGKYVARARMMAAYRRAVLEVAERERPQVLHAHSSYINAHAAHPAARKLGLPLIYEVRTLWGEAAVIENGLKRHSWKHRVIWGFELAAMRRADFVVPIARGIRDELLARGIPADKIEIVGNGVDSTQFIPRARDATLAASAGLDGTFVVGFIGTLRRLEGLATLIDAAAICRAQGRPISVVIVGDGADRPALQERAAQLGLTNVTFTGTVPHGDVAAWYSVMDVLVYPRTRAVINERVTPLKPLEAMALGKVCLASDVGGLTELVRHDETGLIFRADDPADLARNLGTLMDDPEKMARLREAASAYVKNERDWRTIVPRYREIYERAIREKAGTARLAASVAAAAAGPTGVVRS